MTCKSEEHRDQSGEATRLGTRLSERVVQAFQRSWVIELVALVVLFAAYNVIRGSAGKNALAAFAHADDVLRAESWLFPHLEVPLNEWMSQITWVAVPACYFYALMHYAATPGILLLSRRIGGWYYWRGYWTLVLASGIALLIYALYPVAPPRLIPELGIVDVMRQFDTYGWWGSAASAPTGVGDATNQYAAMPSMHFGWALWCAIQMWSLRSRVWRGLALAYPTVLLIVVLATGNHFVLDVAAGAACVLVAYAAVSILGRAFRRATRAEAPEAVASG